MRLELYAAQNDGAVVDQLHMRAAFHRLDADHSKAIDFQEYLQLLGPNSGGGIMQAGRPKDDKDPLKSLLFDLEAEGLTKEDIEKSGSVLKTARCGSARTTLSAIIRACRW